MLKKLKLPSSRKHNHQHGRFYKSNLAILKFNSPAIGKCANVWSKGRIQTRFLKEKRAIVA
jgi:hypothetical protein